MAKTSELNWVELNPASDLSKPAQDAYNAYKAQYAKAKELRQSFEAIMAKEATSQKVLDDDQRLAFSYNFGRLSVAKAAKEAAKTPKSAGGWNALR